MLPVRKAILGSVCAAALAADFAACGNEKVAGGYDDVENPAMQVSLLDGNGQPAASGEVRLYARYQNPWKDSVPVLAQAAPSGVSVKVTDTAVAAAMEAAKLRGTPSPGTDTLEFNLVATGAGGEAYLGGYSLIKGGSGWRFQRRSPGSNQYADAKGVLASDASLLAPVLGQKGQVGAHGMELGLKRVFIPGSPYKAAVAGDGSFTLDRIAAGRYEIKAIAADDKIYSALDSLTAGTDYPGSDWSEADLIWVQKP